MVVAEERMAKLTDGLPSKSAKMRALASAGYKRGDIARFLGTSPQFVRNVLVSHEVKKAKAAEHNAAPRAQSAGGKTGSVKVRLGPDGRIVVPAAFRDALGLTEGDVLFARLEGGEIQLLTPTAAMRRAQAIVRQFVPEGVSLVEELLEDRRREVEREQQHG
jgi:AbrB family looped-hinge helix DNA binding protein